jgi:hypothetical protein
MLSLSLDLGVSGIFSKAKGLGTATYDLSNHPVLGNLIVALADGTGADQSDLAFISGTQADPSAARTIAAGGNDDIDLNNPLSDALGDPFGLAKLKLFLMYADPANAGDLVVGAAPTNPFIGWFGASTHTMKVPPKSVAFRTHPLAGWVVTPGTGDILRVNNPTASLAAYHILLVGTSV